MEEGDRPRSSRPEAGGRPAVCLPRRIRGPSPGGRGRSESPHQEAQSGCSPPGGEHEPGGPHGAGAHAARASGVCVHSQVCVGAHGVPGVRAQMWVHMGLHTRSTRTYVWDAGSECALRCARTRPTSSKGGTSRLTHVEGTLLPGRPLPAPTPPCPGSPTAARPLAVETLRWAQSPPPSPAMLGGVWGRPLMPACPAPLASLDTGLLSSEGPESLRYHPTTRPLPTAP